MQASACWWGWASSWLWRRAPWPWIELISEMADLVPFCEAAGFRRVARARDHFLAMIGHNRRFWAEVAVEIDDDREWIPNGRQSAVLGFTLPGGIDDALFAGEEGMAGRADFGVDFVRCAARLE